MELPQKVDVLKHLATTHRTELKGRRALEWKILISVLSLFAATAVSGSKIPSTIPSLFFIGGYLLISIITIIFLVYVHQANFKSKFFAHNAENNLVAIIENVEPERSLLEIGTWPPKKISSWFRFGNGMWAIFWQSIMILSFGALATLIVIS